jgi:two-component system chemotaxis response regulator CheY
VKQVLSVGQCGFDHGSISSFLQQHFNVAVTPTATTADATRRMRQGAYDLVLVNRQFDADGSEGVDFIDHVKSDPELKDIPVMLITNFREYDEQAIKKGAVPGFGKAELGSTDLVSRLGEFLGSNPSQVPDES